MVRRGYCLAALVVVGFLVTAEIGWAASGSGHVLIALSSVKKLQQSDDPEVRGLARILEKYKYVCCYGAEGPDVASRICGYPVTHYHTLFGIDNHYYRRILVGTDT